MKRDVYLALMKWKASPNRKPLILRGARQVGKTYILKQFGQDCFDACLYVNFEERQDIHALFNSRIEPEMILQNLALLYKAAVTLDTTLIIFDEIQACPDALTSLKYFYEKMPHVYMVAAGSLLGVKLGEGRGFPVGKVDFIDLAPLSFNEFLTAIDHDAYRQQIEAMSLADGVSRPVHDVLLDTLKHYLMVGGMPEAVKIYKETNDHFEVKRVQHALLEGYKSDFAKYSDPSTAIKILNIWNSIPQQLAKESSKFLFNVAKEGARAREYESALIWLEDAGLIHRVENVQEAASPMTIHKNRSSFKVYLLDVGLLSAFSRLSPKLILNEEELFGTFKGAFIENYVLQELMANHKTSIAYWTSQRQAELDFLLEEDAVIYPIEVKAGTNKKTRSLSVYQDKFQPEISIRISRRMLKKDAALMNYPLYAVSRLLM